MKGMDPGLRRDDGSKKKKPGKRQKPMNVFKVFATMSLMDAISKPLAAINRRIDQTDASLTGLSQRLGRFATKMGTAAMAAGALLGVLAATTGPAMAFESKMADVAKVVDFESPDELRAMGRALQDLSLRIPIAAEGFADIVSAAAQSGVAKNDLLEFSEQAAKMGVAFDVAAGDASQTMADWRAGMGLTLRQTYSLADAVNHLSNNMNATAPAISEVLNRAGAVGQAAGFTETQLAALAAAGLSAGASADIVGTGLNSIFATLSSGAGMTKDAARAFEELGFSAADLARRMQADARGTILSVLEAISKLPKENQLSVITSAFGQMSLKSVAPMVGNLDNLRNAFNLVGDAAAYAGSMEGEYAARSATTENGILLLWNALNVLGITLGDNFLPMVKAAAAGMAGLVEALVKFLRTPAGSFLLKLTAGIAAAVAGVTALAAALALVKPLIIMAGAALSPILLPLALIAGAVTLLALAWKNDFLGIATSVKAFGTKVSLVFQGVYAVMTTLKDGQGELSGELGKKIQAAGLLGLVTTVSRVVYRVLSFFKGLWAGIKAGVTPAFERLRDAFGLLGQHLQPIIDWVRKLSGGLTEAAGSTDVATWQSLGETIGTYVGKAFGILVDIIGVAVTIISKVIAAFIWAQEVQAKFWDAIFSGASKAIDVISNFSLYDAGAGLISSLAEGITAKAGALVDKVKGIVATIRGYLPGSDAQYGPLSDLTASGRALPATLAQGVAAGAPQLVSAADRMLGGLNLAPPYFEMPGAAGGQNFFSGRDFQIPDYSLQEGGSFDPPRARRAGQAGRREVHIHIGNLNLPGVTDADGFIAALEALAEERV